MEKQAQRQVGIKPPILQFLDWGVGTLTTEIQLLPSHCVDQV